MPISVRRFTLDRVGTSHHHLHCVHCWEGTNLFAPAGTLYRAILRLSDIAKVVDKTRTPLSCSRGCTMDGDLGVIRPGIAVRIAEGISVENPG